MYIFTARLEALCCTRKSLLKPPVKLKICVLLSFNTFPPAVDYILLYDAISSPRIIESPDIW